MTKVSVGLVDDHQIITAGISGSLSASGQFEVLFTVHDNSGILDALAKAEPDVLLMDVVMPGSIGVDNFKEVLKHYPHQKILAFTALNSPAIIEMLFKQGVKGYVNKNQSLDELKTALFDVFYGRLHLPKDYEFIRRKLNNGKELEELSKREIEILQLIVKEKKTSDIANLLQISVNTVETHRKHLFEKLGVTNLAGLVKVGFERGYLQ